MSTATEPQLVSAEAERDHACEYSIYDLRVAKWPHMRPCGKPAEATVTNRSGKATLRCPDHLF